MLPPESLGWTRVKRKRTRQELNRGFNKGDSLDNCLESCCIIPSIVPVDRSVSRDGVQGKAVFCLPEPGCGWFQGYFFPENVLDKIDEDEENVPPSNSDPGATPETIVSTDARSAINNRQERPWGLLAAEKEIDQCCVDAGYLELDISIFHNRKEKSHDNDGVSTSRTRGDKPNSVSRQPILVPSFSTGGDMMRIRSVGRKTSKKQKNAEGLASKESISGTNSTEIILSFDADKVITGKQTEPYLKKCFRKIVHKVKASHEDEVHEEAWRLLPDCAIVVGWMEVSGNADFLVN